MLGKRATLYLAAIMDLHSRFIVGWALSAVNDRHFTLSAPDKALKRRRPDAGLLYHSDQGCTYASEDYRMRLDAHGITCSMSRRGNCSGEERRSRALRELRPRQGRPRSTTSRCSITNGAATPRSVRSALRNSSVASMLRRRQVGALGGNHVPAHDDGYAPKPPSAFSDH